MATTENTYTGNGSTTLYSFTFPYIEESDVYVTLDGTATTAYSYANATQIEFTTAPASGVAIRIYRQTSSAEQKANFFAGSAIRARDLNDNFTQTLYLSQESGNVSDAADAAAALATTTANTANANSTAAAASAATATQQATASATSAASALAASQQASTDAAAAQASSTAAAASSAQAAADAAQAATDSASAITTAQGAVTTANASSTLATTADGNATTSLNRVNTYLHDGTNPVGDGVGSNPQGLLYAINQAQSAVSDSASAVSTANAASSSASSAVTTANSAAATASAASAAVSAAAFYTPVAALANLPSSPSNEDRVEVVNSTGVESSSAVSGVPSGFVGSTDLTVRLQYNSSTTKWVWQQYFAADPENRYATNYLAVIKGDGTSSGQVGKITLNCSNNNHGVSIQSPAHSAGATYTLTLPVNTGSANQALTTDGSGVLSWANAGSPTIDGGNFTTGGSLVTTTQTIDGGSF